MSRRRSDKRERLIEAAVDLFHNVGYQRASLADVATAAAIPSGNLFYYFKTKAALACAVNEQWCRYVNDFLARLDDNPDPKQRLKQFLNQAYELRQLYSERGCPLAALVRDLRAEEEPLKSEATRIYDIYLPWLEAQFKQIGFPDRESKQHSRFLMAGTQGAILLAYVQNDDSILTDEVERLSLWLDQLHRVMLRKL